MGVEKNSYLSLSKLKKRTYSNKVKQSTEHKHSNKIIKPAKTKVYVLGTL